MVHLLSHLCCFQTLLGPTQPWPNQHSVHSAEPWSYLGNWFNGITSPVAGGTQCWWLYTIQECLRISENCTSCELTLKGVQLDLGCMIWWQQMQQVGKTHETDLLPDQKGTEVDTSCNLPVTLLLTEALNITPMNCTLHYKCIRYTFIKLNNSKKIATVNWHDSIKYKQFESSKQLEGVILKM